MGLETFWPLLVRVDLSFFFFFPVIARESFYFNCVQRTSFPSISLCFGLSRSVTPMANEGPVLKDLVPVINKIIIEDVNSPNRLM